MIRSGLERGVPLAVEFGVPLLVDVETITGLQVPPAADGVDVST